MWNRNHIRKVSFLSLLVIAAGLLAACGGVSQTDFDAAKQQLATQDQKVQALQQQLSAKEKEIADMKKQPTPPSGAGQTSTILGAKQVPTPGPRPTNTPLPPGFTPPPPPPPPVPPASFSEPLKLYIRADTTTSGPGESAFSYDPAGIKSSSCVVTSAFKRGMRIVWRFEIIDVTTGKRLTDQDVAAAIVKLPTGEEIKGRFGRHGATSDAPWFWATGWDVPLDYPLGVLDWEINVTTKDGKSASFKPWAISLPDRGVESRTQIVE